MIYLGDSLLALFCLFVLFVAYCMLRAAGKKWLSQDETNRLEYQKRNDLKGGGDEKSHV